MTVSTDSEGQIEGFWEEHDVAGEVFIDHDYSIGEEYEVRGIPHGVFIDQEGNIREEMTGWQPNSMDEWEQKATELLDDQ